MNIKQMCEEVGAVTGETGEEVYEQSKSGELAGVFVMHYALTSGPLPHVFIDGVRQEPDSYRIVDGVPVFTFAVEKGSTVTKIDVLGVEGVSYE